MVTETDNLKALVLRAYDIKESSKMVDIFSRDLGRLSFMARGAKRKGSPATNLSQPYVEGVFNLVKGRSSFYFKDGQIENAHLELRQSVERLAGAQLGTEILTKVIFNQADPEIYDLTSAYLHALEGADEVGVSRVLGAYILKLISFLGFRPYLNRCVECGNEIREGPYFFSPESGGMVCQEHSGFGPIKSLSPDQYREVLQYMGKSLADLVRGARKENKDTYLAVDRIILDYFLIHTGIERLKSVGMLQALGVL